MALEPEFWAVIDEAVTDKAVSFAALMMQIDDERVMAGHQHGLASFLRIWALKRVQAANNG